MAFTFRGAFSGFCERLGTAVRGVFCAADTIISAGLAVVGSILSGGYYARSLGALTERYAAYTADCFAHAFGPHKHGRFGAGLFQRTINNQLDAVQAGKLRPFNPRLTVLI